jgi:hypothetical protein
LCNLVTIILINGGTFWKNEYQVRYWRFSRRVHVLFVLFMFVCLCIVVSNAHCVLFCFLCFCALFVSLECPFLIDCPFDIHDKFYKWWNFLKEWISSSVLEIFSFTVSFEYWTTGILMGSEHYGMKLLQFKLTNYYFHIFHM